MLLRGPDNRDCSLETCVLNKDLLYGIRELGRQLYNCLQELVSLSLHLVSHFELLCVYRLSLLQLLLVFDELLVLLLNDVIQSL